MGVGYSLTGFGLDRSLVGLGPISVGLALGHSVVGVGLALGHSVVGVGPVSVGFALTSVVGVGPVSVGFVLSLVRIGSEFSLGTALDSCVVGVVFDFFPSSRFVGFVFGHLLLGVGLDSLLSGFDFSCPLVDAVHPLSLGFGSPCIGAGSALTSVDVVLDPLFCLSLDRFAVCLLVSGFGFVGCGCVSGFGSVSGLASSSVSFTPWLVPVRRFALALLCGLGRLWTGICLGFPRLVRGLLSGLGGSLLRCLGVTLCRVLVSPHSLVLGVAFFCALRLVSATGFGLSLCSFLVSALDAPGGFRLVLPGTVTPVLVLVLAPAHPITFGVVGTRSERTKFAAGRERVRRGVLVSGGDDTGLQPGQPLDFGSVPVENRNRRSANLFLYRLYVGRRCRVRRSHGLAGREVDAKFEGPLAVGPRLAVILCCKADTRRVD